MEDVVEIWIGESIIHRQKSSFAPMEGELLNMRGITYRVIGRSFTIDQADNPRLAQMRCNLIVEPTEDRS